MRRRKKTQGGNALVEFALGWSLLSLLFCNAYHFGYGFYVYNQLQTSVSNAVQLASRMDYDLGQTAAFNTQVQNMVLYGDPYTSSGSKSAPGLNPSNISVAVTTSNNFPTFITVSISNYSFSTIFSTMSFDAKPKVTAAYTGTVACSTC